MKIARFIFCFWMMAGLADASEKANKALDLIRAMRPDYDEGLKLLREASDAGDEDAILYLAEVYSAGIGEPRGPNEKPSVMIRRSAEMGNEAAIWELEARLRDGVGMEIDLLESGALAFERMTPRLRRGIPVQRDLQLESLKDLVRKKEIVRIDKLFADGVGEGNVAALRELAEMHAKGIDGAVNLSRAGALLTLAGAKGSEIAALRLDAQQRQRMEADVRRMRLYLRR